LQQKTCSTAAGNSSIENGPQGSNFRWIEGSYGRRAN
jgi:hypothetical protein